MAYGVKWQIHFVALHSNDRYRVDILVDNYNGSVVPLRGAANPFETIEDNIEDAFTPIRKQTGSLRIADNGLDLNGNAFDYTDMLPTNTFQYQVKLWKEGTTNVLRWIGYIRPDSLTSKMFEKVSVREYKLTCPLGTLYEIPVTFKNNKNNMGSVKTIGQILYNALNSLNITWSNLYKQNNVADIADIKAKVSLLNFIGHNEPTHTTPASGDIDAFEATWTDDATSWGSVLEDICRFWGWTLYSRANNLYLITRKQVDQYVMIPFGNLNTLNPTTYSYTPSAINFNDLTYASTNHTECRRLGYKNITIESNVNEKDVVIDPDYEQLEMSFWPVASNPNQIIHVSGYDSEIQAYRYMYALRRLGAYNDQQPSRNEFFDNYQIYENRQLSSALMSTSIISRHDSWDYDSFKTAVAYNLKKGIYNYMAVQPTAIDPPLIFFVKTLEDVCIPLNSVVCINANVVLSYNPDPEYPSPSNTAPPIEDGKPVLNGRLLLAALKIGDLWWDNTNKVWTSQFRMFNLTCHKDGSIVDPINAFSNQGFDVSGILFDDHQGSKGFCVYVNSGSNSGSGLCGRMKLHIYAPTIIRDEVSKLDNGVIDNLTVSIYNTDSKVVPQNKASHEFSAIASNKFRQDLSVSLKMASGIKNVYGLGQLFNQDFTLLDTLTFRDYGGGTSVKQPEDRLLERMTAFYQDVSVQNTIEIMDDATAEIPATIIVKDDATQWHVQNVTHDWRDGTMKLTIINN